MKNTWAIVVGMAAVVCAGAVVAAGVGQPQGTAAAPPYKNAALAPEKRADDLLARMTLDEKIGQMTQADNVPLKPEDVTRYFLGSVLSGGGSEIPDISAAGWATYVDGLQKRAMATRLAIPMIYGIDAVHGHNNVRGAVVFPHNVGLGCTRNPKLVEDVARITAAEVAGTGMHWAFAPCVAVPQDERWGRTYEGFGESPALVAELGAAAVRGLQGPGTTFPPYVLASVKHYVGDGGTIGGKDQGNTQVDEATLRAIHLPGYKAAIDAGAATIMASYNSWNGVKLHGHKYLLTDVLKGELGFKGFIVSDWKAIEQLPGSFTEQVDASINAGLDMIMAVDVYVKFFDTLKASVQAGRVPMSRIDDAVRRILIVKLKMGLFERPYSDAALRAKIGSAEHRAVARRAVRESLVLLKNEAKALPLADAAGPIVVAGGAANDIGWQCGGWTISWQGQKGPVTDGTTILQGLQKVMPKAQITFAADGAVPAGAKTAVVVIGEEPYAEMMGDKKSLDLAAADIALVKKMKAAGLKTIVVLLSGRPMILEPILADADAIVAAWLPGTEGDGVADVLAGAYNPTGKLSHTWPRSMDQIPINVGPKGEPPTATPLFPYGFGLSYK